MNPYALLSLVSLAVYLALGLYAFSLDPRSRVNRLFLALCASFASWGFFYAFVYGAPDSETCWFWYRLSSVGWCNFAGITLHFYMVLSKRDRLLRRWWCYPVLYLPGAAFTVIAFTGNLLITGFHCVDGSWYEIMKPPSIAGIAFSLYYIGYVLLGLVLVWRWGRESGLPRVRRQSLIIVVSTAVGFLLASSVNVFLPLLGAQVLPAIGVSFGMIWLAGIWYSIWKYRLMGISPAVAANEIISKIQDLVALLDDDGNIIRINRRMERILGYREKELAGMPLGSVVGEGELSGSLIARIKADAYVDDGIEVDYRTRDGESIPVYLTGAAMKDNAGEPFGIVVVAHDMRQTVRLREEMAERERANRKLEEAQGIFERDMAMAVNVQRNLLPKSPPTAGEWDVDVLFRPMAGVSGDFYDFYVRDGALVGLSLFDVSGHGISSGLITMIAKPLVFGRFNEMRDANLGAIMGEINARLVREIGAVENFITGVMLRFSGDRVEYANAGHTDLLVRRASTGKVDVAGIEGVDCKGMLLGIEGVDAAYRSLVFRIRPGDQLLIYSDCLLECEDRRGCRWGMDGVMEAFAAAPGGSAAEALESIAGAFRDFVGSGELSDDLTVILIRRRGQGEG